MQREVAVSHGKQAGRSATATRSGELTSRVRRGGTGNYLAQSVRLQRKPVSTKAEDDRAEKEADAVAEAVVRPPEPACPTCASGVKPCAKCASKLQRRAVRGDAPPIAPEQRKVAEQAFGGGGRPLPEKDRTDLEDKLGADLSAVRVHTGVEAEAAAKSVHAHAFTVGADIAFAPGKYDPGSSEGRRLLAHEVAHTLQQDSGKVMRREGETATDVPTPDWSLMDQIKKINDYSWVAPWDESELESLWGQFGDALPSVYDSGGKTDWDISIDKGAELWDLKQVSLAQDQFRNAVAKVAEGYLDENAALVEKEKGALGPDHGPPSEDQINATKERREAAEQVKLARKAVAAFGLIHVGYDNVGFGDVRKPFYPNRPPQKRPKGDEDPPLPTWEQTKEQYDRAQLIIDANTSKFPSLYAIARASGARTTTPGPIAEKNAGQRRHHPILWYSGRSAER